MGNTISSSTSPKSQYNQTFGTQDDQNRASSNTRPSFWSWDLPISSDFTESEMEDRERKKTDLKMDMGQNAGAAVIDGMEAIDDLDKGRMVQAEEHIGTAAAEGAEVAKDGLELYGMHSEEKNQGNK